MLVDRYLFNTYDSLARLQFDYLVDQQKGITVREIARIALESIIVIFINRIACQIEKAGKTIFTGICAQMIKSVMRLTRCNVCRRAAGREL